MRFLYISILAILSVFLLPSVHAQNGFINSLQVNYHTVTFDVTKGGGVKLNHWWKVKEKSRFQSGLQLSAMVQPGASPNVSGDVSEFNANGRLLLFTGWERGFGEKQKWYGTLEGFVGVRAYYIGGSLNQTANNFERNFNKTTFRGDFGSRFGWGYRINERWGIDLGLTTSWLHINHPLGFWTGLLFWSPDVLSVVELGVNVRL
ncbi:MAG: hypothetical protein AAFY71_23560 [Bacteroidota bacterium]